jgi:hypothetical protein
MIDLKDFHTADGAPRPFISGKLIRPHEKER